MNFTENFSTIRVYIAIMAMLFGAYVWAGVSGFKITGDDDATKEERTHASGGTFYHK